MTRAFKLGGTWKGRGQKRERCLHCQKRGLGAMRGHADGLVYRECRYCLSLTREPNTLVAAKA